MVPDGNLRRQNYRTAGTDRRRYDRQQRGRRDPRRSLAGFADELRDGRSRRHRRPRTPLRRDPHARSIVPGESGIAEVEHFLSPTPDVEGIAEGDIVELIAGPFQGEKARVQRIDEGKDQVTVELYEATVPIPVTVRGDQIRVLDSEER